MQQSILWGK